MYNFHPVDMMKLMGGRRIGGWKVVGIIIEINVSIISAAGPLASPQQAGLQSQEEPADHKGDGTNPQLRCHVPLPALSCYSAEDITSKIILEVVTLASSKERPP